MGAALFGKRPLPRLTILYWLMVAIVLCAEPFLAAVIFSFAFLVVPAGAFLFDRLGLRTPELVQVLTEGVLLSAAALSCMPLAFAIGFVVRSKVRVSFLIACLLGGLCGAAVSWNSNSVYARPAAAAAAVVFLGGVTFLLRQEKLYPVSITVAVGYLVLLGPASFTLTSAPAPPASARKMWTAHLEKYGFGQTSSEYTAARSIAFVGDRLAVRLTDRIVALDLKSGSVAAQVPLTFNRYVEPPLFRTYTGALLTVASDRFLLLDEYLQIVHSSPLYPSGRLQNISTDGRAVAWEAWTPVKGTRIDPDEQPILPPGLSVLDTTTLQPNQHFREPGPFFSISADELLETRPDPKNAQATEFLLVTPSGARVVTITCGEGRLLTSTRILIVGCGELHVMDAEGRTLAQARLPRANWQFGGIAEDGSRFALVRSQSIGDPSRTLFEHFVVFNTADCRPVALIRSEHLPERISWSAMSPDGTLFAAGSPTAVSLYRLP